METVKTVINGGNSLFFVRRKLIKMNAVKL